MKTPYSVAICGFGYVGNGMYRMFGDWVHTIYDPKINLSIGNHRFDWDAEVIGKGLNDKVAFNNCDLAIVCVPTPTGKDGWSCDTSIVEEVVSWIETPLILIKSTISVGTTDRLKKKYKKRICFSPEYMGEPSYFTPKWRYPDPINPISHGFMIVGGDKKDTSEVVDIFIRKMGPHTTFMQTDAKTAEFVKYWENTWGAMKVTFANEMYDCAKALGVDYNDAREGWALDPRVEKMHSAVFRNARGYGGKCYSKDVLAFIHTIRKAGYKPRLLEEVVKTNDRIKKGGK